MSRLHARVMWNRGRISIEDVSTNGTAVESEGGSRVLHREKAQLTGEGILRCGCLGAEEDAALVRFSCETAEEA